MSRTTTAVKISKTPTKSENLAINLSGYTPKTDILKKIHKLLEQAKKNKEIIQTILEITPAEALDIANTNSERQRDEKPIKIGALAQSIAAGKWQITTDNAGIDTDGRLTNHQHRFKAFASLITTKPNMKIKVPFMIGLDPNSIAVTDKHAPRTLYDDLKVAGHKYATTAEAQVVQMVLFYEQASTLITTNSSVRIQQDEKIKFYENKNQGGVLRDLSKKLKEFFGTMHGKALPQSHWLFVWYILRAAQLTEEGQAKVAEFIRRLVTGAGLQDTGKYSVVFHLFAMLNNWHKNHERLKMDMNRLFKKKNMNTTVFRIKYIVAAWNLFAKGAKDVDELKLYGNDLADNLIQPITRL